MDIFSIKFVFIDELFIGDDVIWRKGGRGDRGKRGNEVKREKTGYRGEETVERN